MVCLQTPQASAVSWAFLLLINPLCRLASTH
jgi:hypothetical protein